uniref:YadA-like family protein n=1 Tax=Ignatzschineria larvae TaxID=112009 RepID=UPI000479F1EB
QIDLAKDIDLGADGSVKTGNTVVDNSGVTVKDAETGESATLGKDGLTTVGADGKAGPSVKGDGIDAGGKVITDVADGVNGKDAVNKDQLDSVQAIADKGLSFAGDDGSEHNFKLGETVNILGGATELTDNNIGVNVNSDGDIEVKLAKDIDLGAEGSLKTGNTIIDNNGLTIVNGPNVTVDGIDAGDKIIKNVADGSLAEDSQDAVNGSQLYNTNKVISDGLMGTNGGGILNPDGTLKSPDFSEAFGKQEGTITNVYDGFDYLNKNINGVVNGSSGLVILNPNNKNEIIFNQGLVGGRDTFNVSNGVDADGDQITTKITGVTDGKIHQDSSDAINGSQLVDSNINMGNHLGGGAGYQTDANGEFIVDQDGNHIWQGPTYTLKDENGQGVTYDNVGDALGNLDNRVDKNTGDIKNLDDRVTNIEGDIKNVTGDVSNITDGKAGIIQVGKGDQTGQVVIDDGIAKGGDLNIAKDNGAGDDRKLTGVKDGTISKDSSDAINGSQLYNTNDVMANIIGGGLTLNEDGSLSYPNNKFQVNGNSYNNIAEAIEAVDQGQLFRVEKDKEGNVTQIGINNSGDAGKTNTISFANGSVARKVTGVAPGEISATSTDAINGSQLHVVKEDINNINYTLNHYNTRMNNIEKTVHQNRKMASAGIAGAMAMSSIPYIEYSKYSFGMGLGYYDNESAVSLGVQGKLTDRSRFRLQMSYDTQNKIGVGVGIAFEW